MPETETSTTTSADDDQALLERLAKREERRQRRMKEAMERQKELDATISATNCSDSTLEEQSSISNSRQGHTEEEEVADTDTNSWGKEDKFEDEKVRRRMCDCTYSVRLFDVRLLCFFFLAGI